MTFTMFYEHLLMVLLAVLLTIVIGVPVGVCAYIFPKARAPILRGVEILQTIPALALLGIIMVFLGGGKQTVIVGLFLYSMLPVVLNTYTGLAGVEPSIKEAATGIGMTRMNRLLQVELPLAFPLIVAGIRIATVTSIGTAVFAASVGGGGIGSAINRGIRISDMELILSGTAAMMALAVVFDAAMAFIERRLRRRLLGREK